MKNYLKSDFEYSSNYRLTRLLGTGAFADIYLGEHIYLNSQVAIKVLHTQVDTRATGDFLTEARHLSHLMHPHIIRVFDFGIENQTPYLVMDYAPHGNLRELHPPGTAMPLSTVVSYTSAIASALQFAHDQHLLHRDHKPSSQSHALHLPSSVTSANTLDNTLNFSSF